MRFLAGVCVFAISCAQAQDAARDSREPFNWALIAAERFTGFSNPVVSTHSLARLAAIVCSHDRDAGSILFERTFRKMEGLKDDIFRDPSIPHMPADSLSSLWNTASAAATKCDSALVRSANDPALKERLNRERSSDSLSVLQAATSRIQADPERASQLAEFVMETVDPAAVDYEALALFLGKLRDRAPDLSDELFEAALSTAVAERNTASFSILGKYLFTSARISASPFGGLPGPIPTQDAVTYQGSNSRLYEFSTVRGVAQAQQISRYIRGLTEMITSKLNSSDPTAMPQLDLEAAGTLAEFMAKHAGALELPEEGAVNDIVRRLTPLLAGKPRPVALIRSLQNSYPKVAMHIAVRKILELIRSKDFDQARASIAKLDGPSVAGQVTLILNFAEAAAAIENGDTVKAVQLIGQLSGRYINVKKTLLYAALISKTTPEQGESILVSARQELAPLPPEFRTWLNSLLARALLKENPDRALGLLSEIVQAQNAARTAPRNWRFGVLSPPYHETDIHPLLLTKDGIAQMSLWHLRVPFAIPLTGAYTLADVLHLAPPVDLLRLEIAALELKDETQRADALLELAELHFKAAELPR
jgi:hypothetical protein